MSSDPLDVLLDIEHKCRAFGRPLPRQKMSGKIWQGVGYKTSTLKFITPLDEVIEVAPIPTLTPLPSSAEWFLGVANLRGHLLPVTDLQGFISGEPQTMTPFSRIMVTDFEQTEVGFLVQEVYGVQRFFENSLKQDSPDNLGQYKNYSQGYFEQGGDKWHIFSLRALSKIAEFYHVIKETGV